jgi:Rrf2 family protein
MKISTRGDYATRALQELALHHDEGPLSVEVIAERQGLPVRYLEQLFLVLRRAGCIASRRGVNGGYYLAKSPKEITLGDILRAVDGPVAPIFCVTSGKRPVCPVEGACALQEVWAEVRDAVSHIVDRTTLEDVRQRARVIASGTRLTYQI